MWQQPHVSILAGNAGERSSHMGNYDYEMPRILEALRDIRSFTKGVKDDADYTAQKSQDIQQEIRSLEDCIMALVQEEREQTKLLRQIADKFCVTSNDPGGFDASKHFK